MNNFIHRKTR